MKNAIITLFLVLFTTALCAQAVYEKGYYINTIGVRTEGYLKLIDFDQVNQDTDLDFKNEGNKVEKIPIESITEFGVGNELKFQKVTVQMDDVNLYDHLNHEKELSLKQTILFLNILVEGKATLYSTNNGNGTKYFYKVSNSEIKQLVYKKYDEGGATKENTIFRKQLFDAIKCDEEKLNDFLGLEYDKKELISAFQKYNSCKGDNNAKTYENRFERKLKLKFSVLAGVCIFDPNDTGFGFGAECEVFLPSERISFYVKLGYENTSGYYASDYYTANTSNQHHDTYDFSAKSLNLVGGFRYYIPIVKNHKVFFNAGVGLSNELGDITYIRSVTNGTGTFTDDPVNENLKASLFFTGGIGYVFRNKFGLSLNYDGVKHLFKDHLSNYEIHYTKIGIDLRYTFN